MKGIVIPVLEKYETILLHNIIELRNRHHCNLPIELWQIGQELSIDMQNTIQVLAEQNANISFKNVNDFTTTPEHWQGWQIKAFCVKHTTFDEVLLCDCDIVFLQNPEIIFNDEQYITTGTYFFRDYEHHRPTNLDEFQSRVHFVKNLLPEKNSYFPQEWDFIYDNYYHTQKHKWYYQESGMVYIDKTRHIDTIETIYQLNFDHKNTYKFIWGDKESFWFACVINIHPFTMNDTAGYNHLLDTTKIYCKYLGRNCVLTHKYKNTYFFSQKGYPRICSEQN
jgi:NADH:ubiquinone oxidoreductase subunit